MIAELGNYGLALALALSIFLAILPLVGAEKGNAKLMALGRPLTWAMFLALSLSFGSLFYLFALNDFSVQYVVNFSARIHLTVPSLISLPMVVNLTRCCKMLA